MSTRHPTAPAPERVLLTRATGTWTGMAVLFGVLAAPLVAIGLVGAGYGLYELDVGWVVLGPVVACAGLGPGFLARQCLRMARTSPELELTGSELIVHDTGLLRSPLPIARSAVHSVYVGPLNGPTRPAPWRGRRGWDAVRMFLRTADAWAAENGPEAVSPWGGVPDLSTQPSARTCNLLVVLHAAIEAGDRPRRGFALVDLLARSATGYDGPVRGWRLRGFLGRVDDEDHAVEVLAVAFPAAPTPSPEMAAWLRCPVPELRDVWAYLRRPRRRR